MTPRKTTSHSAVRSKSQSGSKSRKTTKRASAPGEPIFAQPVPSPDPVSFKHPVTDRSYRGLKLVEAVPQPRTTGVEPVLTLQEVYGGTGAAKMKTITAAGQIVFHCVGDTGSTKSPTTQNLVSDKMVADFSEANAADVPSFFYHLGDVVYYFGEAAYYYDQFYEPFREYPAPILGIPGNHDGVLWSGDPAPTLAVISVPPRRSSHQIPVACCAPR